MTVMDWDRLHRQKRHQLRYPNEHVIRFLASIRHKEDAPRREFLDIGCGSGRHMKAAHDFGFQEYGVDPSPIQGHTRMRQGSMTALPFQRDRFDAAIAFGVFYYGDRRTGSDAIGELWRVLKPGARAFVVVRSLSDWRVAGVPSGEPEHGMEMHFIEELDIPDLYGQFDQITWELSEWTTHNMTRLNSDWLITVTK